MPNVSIGSMCLFSLSSSRVGKLLEQPIGVSAGMMCEGLNLVPQESWYEKLNRWEEALKAYDAKREESPPGSIAHLEASMGRLRSVITLVS